MADFLMIAPAGWYKVEDASVFTSGAQSFAQYEGYGEVLDVTDMFIAAGIITDAQAITTVKYMSETNDVWYSVRDV